MTLITTLTLLSLLEKMLIAASMASVFGVTTLFFQSQINIQQSLLLIISCIVISLPFIREIKIIAIDTGVPVLESRFINNRKGSKIAISSLLLKHLLAKLYVESGEKAKTAATDVLNSLVKVKSTATNERDEE